MRKNIRFDGNIKGRIKNRLFLMHSLRRVAAEAFWQVEFGFDLGEDFAVFLGLFPGEFAVLAADGEVVLVFGLGGLQIGLYAGDC